MTSFLFRVSSLILLTLCLAAFAAAQIAGGLNETTDTNWGGNNFIAGTVFWPTGSPVNTRMGLRLRSLTRGEVLATTDDSGRFVFSRVSTGIYTVVIEADKDFESVAQEVEILQSRNPIPQTFTLTIRLRDRRKFELKPAVVDVENAGVPKRAFDLYMKAGELAKANDHRGAIVQLELAIVEYPKFMNAYNEIGVQYLRLNELEKADGALQSALKIKPDAFEPMMNRGIALFRLNRHADAEQVLREALKLKASAVARYYIGRLLIKLGRGEEAEKELIIAVDLGADEFKEAHRLLAVIYLDRGERLKVVEQLETYLRMVPSAPDAAELRQVIQQNKTAAAVVPIPGTKP